MKLRRNVLFTLLILSLAFTMPARSQEVTTGPSSGDIPSLIQEAKDRLNRGDPDGALQAYEAVIAKDPKNIVALYFAGNLNLQLHKIVPGLTLLSRAAALAPTDPRLWLLLGKAYEQYATTEDALRAYKHVEEIAPGSPQAKDADKRLRLLSGKKMLSLGSPKQAQAIFSSLLKDYPNDSALQNEVNALNRPPEQTASTLKGELSPEKQAEASRLASSDIPSLIQEAKSRLNRHDPEGALQAYEAVIAKDPNNIVALYFAGNLNLQLKKIVPGLTLLSRAATLAPTDPKLWLLLGKAYEQYATIEDALRVYRHVQEIAPGTPQAQEADKRLRLLSGKKLLSLGSTKQAQEIFSNLLNDYPKDPAVLTEIKALNQAREQTRSHVTSELTPEKLEEAAKQMSGDIPTLLTEGRKFVANNDPKNALKTYEAVLSKDSNNIEALFFAGNLYLASNQPEPGLKYLARAVSILPKNVKLRMALAEAYERFNHTEDARREYQDVIGLSGKTNEGKEANKKFQLLSGKLALSQGQADQALEIFSRLKDDYPNDPEVLSEIEAANRAKNLTQGPGEGGKGIAPGLAPSIEVASLMADAKTRLAKNDIKGALAIFEEILAKDPNNFEALYFAGNINLQLKNPKQGLTYLTKCISVAPNNLRLRLFVAQSYERYNFLGDALREYGNIVGLGIATPEGQEANKRFQFLSGLRALHQGNADQSLVVFKGLLQEYPSDTAALTGIVNAYIAAKKIDYAKNLLEWIVAHNPYDAAAHFYLAGFYERLGNLLQAIDQYSIVLRQIPRDAPEFREANLKIATIKGQLALQSNDFSDAKHSYEQLLSLDPGNTAAQVNLAMAYHGLGDNAEAVNILQGILKQNPDFLNARTRLGALYTQMGRLEDAAVEFEETRIRGWGSPIVNDANRALSSIYALAQGNEMKTKVEDGLINKVKKALAQDPDNYDAWSRLALLYGIFGNSGEAQNAYENAVRIKPQDTHALEILAGLYDDGNNFTKAESTYTRALDSVKDPAARQVIEQKLVMVSGKKAFDEKKMDVAEAKFKEAVASNPQNYTAYFYLGIINSINGKYREAAQDYEKTVDIVPSYAAARYRLGIIYEQLKRDEDALSQYRAMLNLRLDKGLEDAAKNEIETVENRIQGFDFSINYSVNYTNNYLLTKVSHVNEIYSNLAGNINFHHKLYRKPASVGISLNPTYVVYHASQTDTLGGSVTPFIVYSWRDLDFSTNLTYSEANNFSLNIPSSKSYNFGSDVSRSIRMPALLPWLAAPDERKATLTTWRFNIGANQVKSEVQLNNLRTYTLGFSLNQSSSKGWRWSGGLNFIKTRPINSLGNDLANDSYGLSAQLSKFISAKMSVFGGYSYARLFYTYPDSFALFTKKRKSGNHSINLGLNYFLDQNLRFFCQAAYQLNRSNLPTGFIVSPQDLALVIGAQNPSQGYYTNLTASAGIALSF